MLLVTTPTILWTRSIMIIGIIWNGFNLSLTKIGEFVIPERWVRQFYPYFF